MATKTCPACGEEVPTSASRCKHCFHEFSAGGKKKGLGPLMIVGLIAAMVCVGAGVMYYVLNFQSVRRNVVIDEETSSIVWTRTYADKVETDRLAFADVEKVESIMGGSNATYEVMVVTTTGERFLLNQSNDVPLTSYAQHISHVIDKPMVEVRKIKGFGEQYGEQK